MKIVENLYEKLGINSGDGDKTLKYFYRKKVKENFGNDEKLAEITATYELLKNHEFIFKEMEKGSLMLKKVELEKQKRDLTPFLKKQFENPFEVGR